MSCCETQNLAVGYGAPLLRDIALHAERGKILALIGPNGAGKSTLLKTLAGQLAAQGGAVLLDGVDVRDYPLEELRSRIGMVLQTNVLFTGTIRENLKWGKEDATEEEIIQAAKDAQAYDFIMALPDGYHTMVGEGGSTLSGGEKQRVSIARAILKDAPIVILDEATSSVDPENEHLLLAAIRELTVFFFIFSGIYVIYTVQMMLYTQHIGSGTGKVTHAFEFKLVDTGKFEYVRMYALSPEYELMKDANFE